MDAPPSAIGGVAPTIDLGRAAPQGGQGRIDLQPGAGHLKAHLARRARHRVFGDAQGAGLDEAAHIHGHLIEAGLGAGVQQLQAPGGTVQGEQGEGGPQHEDAARPGGAWAHEASKVARAACPASVALA